MTAEVTVQKHVNRFIRQPQSGIVAVAAAALATFETWTVAPPVIRPGDHLDAMVVLAVLLAGALYLASLFPIHIRHTTKMELGSASLFLMAALLPPAVAPITAFAGLAITDFLRRKSRQLYWYDIAAQAGRLGFVVWLASVAAHLPVQGVFAHAGVTLGAAVVLGVGDLLTIPLVVAPITGERAQHIVKEGALSMGPPESVQYFLGLMGAALAAYDAWALSLLLFPIVLLYRLSKRAKEMHESTRLLLENMADTVDSRDEFTHEHSKRVTDWTRDLIKQMKITSPEVALIITAARVHDIGKLAVPDPILHKHERLTDEEWSIMQQHPAIGADMLKSYPAFARGAGIVRGHHERFDGKGYPDGIAGTDIPFGARVIAVCDSFDAMVSDRPYRKGMAWERAAGILASGRGTQWDPEIVDAFLQVLEPHLAAQRERDAVPAGAAPQPFAG